MLGFPAQRYQRFAHRKSGFHAFCDGHPFDPLDSSVNAASALTLGRRFGNGDFAVAIYDYGTVPTPFASQVRKLVFEGENELDGRVRLMEKACARFGWRVEES